MIFRIYHSEYRIDIIEAVNEFEAICYLLSQPPIYSNWQHYVIKPQIKYGNIDRITGLWDNDHENVIGNSRLVFVTKPKAEHKDLNSIITPHMRRVTLEHNRQMAEMVQARLNLKGINPGSPDPIYSPLSKVQWTQKQIAANDRFVKSVNTFVSKIR